MTAPVIAKPLTPDAFATFGTVFESPASGRIGPIPVVANTRPGVPTTLVLLHLIPGPGHVDVMERHHHSGQCFFNLGGGRLLVVVAPDAGGAPDLARVSAFLAGPTQGFDYAPGVWHAGVSSVDGETRAASLLCRDGSDDDVEVVSLATAVNIVVP